MLNYSCIGMAIFLCIVMVRMRGFSCPVISGQRIGYKPIPKIKPIPKRGA